MSKINARVVFEASVDPRVVCCALESYFIHMQICKGKSMSLKYLSVLVDYLSLEIILNLGSL